VRTFTAPIQNWLSEDSIRGTEAQSYVNSLYKYFNSLSRGHNVFLLDLVSVDVSNDRGAAGSAPQRSL
jgi:hypothetical protein